MNLTEQVSSLEQSKKLYDLYKFGEDIYTSALIWVKCSYHDNCYSLRIRELVDIINTYEWYPAFTASELGVVLPHRDSGIEWYVTRTAHNHWHVSLLLANDKRISFNLYPNEAEARASLLIYLIEHKLVQTPEQQLK